MAEKQKINFNDIQLLVMDVDGVLTEGAIIINSDGSETKAFNVADGHGIRMWKRAGLQVAFLSGRFSLPTAHRAEQLEIDHCIQDSHHKLPSLKQLLDKLGLSPSQVAYIGDDLLDLPPMRYVGFSAAVANAVDEVKEHADFVTSRCGGKGAAREVIEYILKNSGRWKKLMDRYLV